MVIPLCCSERYTNCLSIINVYAKEPIAKVTHLRPNYIYQVLGRDSAFGRVHPSVISPDSTWPSDAWVIFHSLSYSASVINKTSRIAYHLCLFLINLHLRSLILTSINVITYSPHRSSLAEHSVSVIGPLGRHHKCHFF